MSNKASKLDQQTISLARKPKPKPKKKAKEAKAADGEDAEAEADGEADAPASEEGEDAKATPEGADPLEEPTANPDDEGEGEGEGEAAAVRLERRKENTGDVPLSRDTVSSPYPIPVPPDDICRRTRRRAPMPPRRPTAMRRATPRTATSCN